MCDSRDKDICAACDELLLPIRADELTPGESRPCPKCGSTRRIVTLRSRSVTASRVTATLTVITYPQNLLSVAQQLIQDQHYSIAVVVVHMACEVAVAGKMSEAFAKAGIQHLEEPIEAFLSGYSLANDRLRALYVALTSDNITDQPFWTKFKESARRRNDIIHRGERVGKPEAEESLAVGKAFVAHLGVSVTSPT